MDERKTYEKPVDFLMPAKMVEMATRSSARWVRRPNMLHRGGVGRGKGGGG